jgi:hypothetical protein
MYTFDSSGSSRHGFTTFSFKGCLIGPVTIGERVVQPTNTQFLLNIATFMTLKVMMEAARGRRH